MLLLVVEKDLEKIVHKNQIKQNRTPRTELRKDPGLLNLDAFWVICYSKSEQRNERVVAIFCKMKDLRD